MKNSNKFLHKPNLVSQSKGDKFRSDGLEKRIITLEHVITSKLKTINGLVFRNKGRGLIGLILKLVRGIRPRLTKSVVKQVALFSFRCYRIASCSGLKGLVLYLKACQVLLQQSVGGYRVFDLSELKVRPSRNRAGVPLIIPAGARVLVSRDRDIPTIRLWMTLLGFYRILEFRGKLSLSTITDKGPDLSLFLPEWEDFLEKHFLPSMKKFVTIPGLEGPSIFPILKSGPTSGSMESNHTSYTNSSAKALIIAARAWLKPIGRHVELLKALKVFIPQIPGASTLISRMQTVAMACSPLIDDPSPRSDDYNPYLGKLGFKSEPAGKVRVFAMVDAWTQWLMKPLHDWLFNILRQIPQDGTFDQLSPISKLQDKYSKNPKGMFASIDLSAATDRLPISLQVSLLKVLLKDKVPNSTAFAEAWADLLIKRPYEVPVGPEKVKAWKPYVYKDFHLMPGLTPDAIEIKKPRPPSPFEVPSDCPKEVVYGVGQPMGALSSWAMLAMTHHAMMQYSAFKAGSTTWYSDYAVLGDDGLIKGSNQTKAYRSLLDKIGVKAGLAKSILAKNKFVIEFAKKFFVDSTTANMLPFKECAATWISTSLVTEFVRKYELSFNSTLSFLGYGYKAKMRAFKTPYFKLPTRMRVLLVWLSHPSSPLGRLYWVDWLLQKSWSEVFTTYSHDCMEQVLTRIRLQNERKLSSIRKSFNNYRESLEEPDKELDKLFPIKIITAASASSHIDTYEMLVPWKAVLSSSLHSEDVDYDWLSSWNDGGSRMSHHGLRFKGLYDLKVGVDLKEIVDNFNFGLEAFAEADVVLDDVNVWLTKNIDHESLKNPPMDINDIQGLKVLSLKPVMPEYALPIEDRVDIACRYFFELDELKAQIPEKFWENERQGLKPFKDFISVYKFWQDVTKPIWAESYGKDLSIPITSESRLRRGTKEGLVNHHIPSITSNMPWWGDFLLGFLFTIIVLELLTGKGGDDSSIGPLLYNIVSYESEIMEGSVSSAVRPISYELNWYAIGPIVAGSLLLLATLLASIKEGQFYDPSWYLLNRGSPEVLFEQPNIPILQLDTVMVGQMRISGPISANSLDLIRIHMENQVLLENLAISPIGALWECSDSMMTPITSLLG